MATYKVIQDIEAEDHILGPLTLRQFIYALVTIFFGYLSFVVIDKHVFFMLLFFVPPGVLFGFLAFPFGRDQPNEVWALARLRFILKPRRRLWNQSGAKELVSVTAPKREGRQLTNGLTKAEVNNRLQALALMIDSRGWAIKNLATIPLASDGIYPQVSDRLIDPGTIPKSVPDYDLTPENDILDEQNNPIAIQMSSMINKSSAMHRQQLIRTLNGSVKPKQQEWFNGNDEGTISTVLKAKSQASNLSLSRMHNIDKNKLQLKSAFTDPNQNKLPTQQPAPTTQDQSSNSSVNSHNATILATKPNPTQAQTKAKDPAILNLANNNDLNVATIASEAKRSSASNEVVINLR